VIHAQCFFDLVENQVIIESVRQVTMLKTFCLGGQSGIENFLFQAPRFTDAVLNLGK
jgi:hypothetical protein